MTLMPHSKNITLPTALTALRVMLTFVVLYMAWMGYSVIEIAVVFAIAALTDLFDGILARTYGSVSNFGARFDMVADRFLWVTTVLALFCMVGSNERFVLQLLAIMTREILTLPFALYGLLRGKAFPQTQYVAKVNTFIQGFAIPALLLSLSYPAWGCVSVVLSTVLAVTGILSAREYALDVMEIRRKPLSQ